MKSLTTKKIIVVFSVIFAVIVGMLVLGLSFGNTNVPTVDSPSQVVYEKTDENGDVIYTITKQELYEQMKTNNGVNLLLGMIDTTFIADYIDDVTQTEIDEKIEFLTYQTNDQDVIEGYDDQTIADLEENFQRSMILSGYHDGGEETYARLVIARENFVLDQIEANGDVTENNVANFYINSYFEDIQAIRLRFLNVGDGRNVLEHFNLSEVDDSLALYLGYTYLNEDLLDSNDDIVEAQITEDAYYLDVNDDLKNIYDELAYSSINDDDNTYIDRDDNVFTMDDNGNIIDDESNIIVDHSVIFDDLESAEAHQEANTTYYTLVQNNDIIEVYDLDDVLTYKIDGDIIYNSIDQDVTNAVDLRINKEFTDIEEVQTFTENNTSALTDEEVLSYFIKMYNYLYGEYRVALDENATAADIIALDSDYFGFNYETVQQQNQSLANFMFNEISAINEKVYSSEPKNIGDYAYMVYKLSEGEKIDLKQLVMDVIKEAIIVPETATDDIELITEGPYDSTISWSSSNPDIISNAGVLTIPEENSIVSLSYTITALGVTDTGVKIIQVPTSGETSEIGTFDETTVPTLKSLLDDDDLYDEIETLIIEDKVYGASASTNISQYMTDARKAANLEIYDFFMALDYASNFDSEYEFNDRGSKSTLASIELADGTTHKVTAETFYQNALSRNPSLMVFYASQYKEALHSDYFEVLFGTDRDILRNDSEFMGYLDNYVASIKNEYNQLISNPTYLNLYEQYYGWNFDTFQTYLYSRYRVENEKSLLENLVLSELRMLFIEETLNSEDIVDTIYDVVEDNYNNFFSLEAKQILIYFDFDEDGELDDYNDYYDSLDSAEKLSFDAMVSQLETLIKDSDDNFTDIVSDYEGVDREDEDWGAFKQHGFILKYESLNPRNDNDVEQSLTYSGEYGVKDQYIDEFTDALIELYNEYQNPINQDLESMLSDLVPTEFGLHLIEVEQGDDFDGISLMIETDDYDNISSELLNDNDMPSLAQVDAYFTYKLYDQYNDIENVSMVNKYGITLPIIPDRVLSDLDIYVSGTLQSLFTSNMVNYSFILQVADGEIVSDFTQAEFDSNIQSLLEIYYDVTIGTLIDEE